MTGTTAGSRSPHRALRALRGDHANARRLLDLMQIHCDALRSGRGDSAGYLIEMLDYTTGFADRVHHPREDVLFERVAVRNPKLRDVVDRLLGEHRQLADDGGELIQLLDQVVGGESIPIVNLCSQLSAYIQLYRDHMQREELELFAVADHLDAADWLAVEGAAVDREDPLFGRVLEDRFRELYAELLREEAQRGDSGYTARR